MTPRPLDFDAVVAPVSRALLAWMLGVEGQAVAYVDTGAPGAGRSFRTDRGELKAGMDHDGPTLQGVEVVGVLKNTAPHALVAHEGRRPGSRMGPVAEFEGWARRVLGLSPEEARRAAFPLARANARKGAPGNPFLLAAAQEAAPDLAPMIRAAAARGLADAMPPQTL